MTPNHGNFVPWQLQTLTFTANATSEIIDFMGVGATGLPPVALLDGVSVDLVTGNSSVPEPVGLMLLGSGLLGMLATRRHRSKLA